MPLAALVRGQGLGAVNRLNILVLCFFCIFFFYFYVPSGICDYVCLLDSDYTIIKYMTCCMHIYCIICMVNFCYVELQECELDNSRNGVKNIGI